MTRCHPHKSENPLLYVTNNIFIIETLKKHVNIRGPTTDPCGTPFLKTALKA